MSVILQWNTVDLNVPCSPSDSMYQVPFLRNEASIAKRVKGVPLLADTTLPDVPWYIPSSKTKIMTL